MVDADYWKRLYKDLWAESSQKEEMLARLILNETKREVRETGLGAGTDVFISGSAVDNGYKKGDADLNVLGTNIFIEVTGPMSNAVGKNSPLWFRPDKIENAIANIQNNHDTFLAHYLPKESLWRVIQVNDDFVLKYNNGEYPIGPEIIRGVKETYCHIPANDTNIKMLPYLISYIKNYGNAHKEICSICGNDMVVRIARTGLNAGKQFLGCKSYPNCKYTKNIREE